MIKLTKINGSEFFVNADLIEFIEATPDSIITLTTGKKLIVREDVDVIVDRFISYKGRTLQHWENLRENRQ